MLRFKQWLQLLEGLTSKQKSVVSTWVPESQKVKNNEDDWTTKNALRLSSHAIPPGQNHIRIPIPPRPVEEHPTVTAVKEHLKRHGYEIHDPNSGFAVDSVGKKHRIKGLLDSTGASGEMQRDWEHAPKAPKDLSDTHEILISRNANDVAGCGTDKKFPSSCITLDKDATIVHYGGENGKVDGDARDKLPGELQAGTHVAYLVPKKPKKSKSSEKDNQIDDSVSRILLKPHESDSGHEILYPEDKAYSHKTIEGTTNETRFQDAVRQFAQQNFPMRDEVYYKHQNVYNDDDESERVNSTIAKKKLIDKLNAGNFDSEHIRHAKKHGYYDNEVHEAYNTGLMNRLQNPEKPVDANHLKDASNNGYFNDDLKLASQKRLINDLHEGKFDYEHVEHAQKNGYWNDDMEKLSKQKLIENLDKGITNSLHVFHHQSDPDVVNARKRYILNKLKKMKTDFSIQLSPEDENYRAYHEDNPDVNQASLEASMARLKAMKTDPNLEYNGEIYPYNDNEEHNKLSKEVLLKRMEMGKLDKKHLDRHRYDSDVYDPYYAYLKKYGE